MNKEFTFRMEKHLSAQNSSEYNDILFLSGEMDSYALKLKSLDLKRTIENYTGKSLIIDLSELSFLNSEAVSLLFEIQEKLSSKNVKLSLVSAPQNIWDVLNQVGFFKVVSYFPDLKSINE